MLTNLPAYLANARKAIINILGMLLLISDYILPVVPGRWHSQIAMAVLIMTAIVHYITSNAPAPGSVPAVSDGLDVDEENQPTPIDWLPASEVVTASQVASDSQIAAPPADQVEPAPNP